MTERRYGKWGGDPQGQPENKEDCIETVTSQCSGIRVQCSRKRGHGPDGLYCKQHAKKQDFTFPKK